MSPSKRIRVLCPTDFVHEGAINTVRREVNKRLDRNRFEVYVTSYHTPRQPQGGSFLSHFDIVHLDQLWFPNLLLKLRNLRTAFIETVHSLKGLCDRRNYLVLGRLVHDRFIAPSVFIANHLQEKCRIRSDVAYNGVDSRLFNPSNKDPEFLEAMGIREPCFLFAGRFSVSKRIDLLLHTASIVKDAIFVLKVADHQPMPLLRFAEEHRRRMDLQNLLILPRSPHHSIELRRLFASCTAYLHPCENEACSLSILESMSSGTPVISVFSGSTPELVLHEKTGLLVRPGDARSLAEACRRIIDDPKAKRIMGKAASERVRENFTWEKAAQRHEEIYKDTMQNR